MPFHRIFATGENQQRKGHLKNLILMANAYGFLDEAEKKLLRDIAKKAQISDEVFDDIWHHPEHYEFNPPVNKHDRYERFVHMVQMIAADKDIEPLEEDLLHKVGMVLGLPANKIDPCS